MKTEDKTREQLLDELAVLRQRVAKLKTSEAERKRLEHALGKRMKELKCLYDISHIAEKPGIMKVRAAAVCAKSSLGRKAGHK